MAMDNGSVFLKQSFQISMAFEQLLNFLFSSDAPVDLLKDMLLFKEKFDRYRKSFSEAYLNRCASVPLESPTPTKDVKLN